jgi:hypothetical protein
MYLASVASRTVITTPTTTIGFSTCDVFLSVTIWERRGWWNITNLGFFFLHLYLLLEGFGCFFLKDFSTFTAIKSDFAAFIETMQHFPA